MAKDELIKHSPTQKAKSALQLSLSFGGCSEKGLKAENQDAFAAFVPTNNDLQAKGAVAAIADGVSSANHAAEASQLAVTQFINEYYATSDTWSTRKSAAKVLTSLNQWLYSQGGFIEQQQYQWLTTFSAIIFKSTTGYIFHAGDTRIAKYREQQLETLTRDHNRKQGAKSVVLTRALGADSRLEVDCSIVDLRQGDLFVLTCDGIHESLDNKAIKQLLAELPVNPSSKALEETSRRLVDNAIIAGSQDNVSCLLVYINNVPSRALEEVERDLMSQAIPPALDVGMKIDDYQVKKILHASIRSHLYLVEDQKTAEVLVLKTPSANFAEDSTYLQGFRREAWVGERIKHGNVMTIKSGKQDSQFLYHLCEYVDGQTLTQWLRDNPKPNIAQVRDIALQIIGALRAFQRLELVHRDLKPDNVMIDSFGQVKLIDYGTVYVASLEENHENIADTVPQGSLNYIAPETMLSMKADFRSDLFSLGVICYEMLTGTLPFKPMTRAEVTFDNYEQWHYRPLRHSHPHYPLWLDLALERATSPNPADRFQAFSEFHMELNKPNLNALEAYKNQPLLQRDPVKFWQMMSLVLFLSLILSFFL